MPVVKIHQLSEQVVTASGGYLTSSLDASDQDILNVGTLTATSIEVDGGIVTDPLKLYATTSGMGSIDTGGGNWWQIDPTLSELQNNGLGFSATNGIYSQGYQDPSFFPNHIVMFGLHDDVIRESGGDKYITLLTLNTPVFRGISTYQSTKLSDIVIDYGGSGYGTGTLVVTIWGDNTGPAQATATQFGGVISSVTITEPGSGYTSTPTVILTNPGGTGSGAVLTAKLGSTQLMFDEATTNDTITLPAGITGDIAVLEDGLHLTVPGNLNVAGNATVVGNLTFGDMPTDTVTFVADVDSHIVPEVSGTYNLGSPTYPWDTLYIETLNVNDKVDSHLLPGLDPDSNDSYALGNFDYRWRSLTVSHGVSIYGDSISGLAHFQGGELSHHGPYIRSGYGFDIVLDSIMYGNSVHDGAGDFTISTSGARPPYEPGQGYGIPATEIFRVKNSGDVHTGGDVTPTASGSYDLGSPTKPWGTLYTEDLQVGGAGLLGSEITLGTPADTDLSDGLFPFETSTTITDAIDNLNETMSLLAPEAPSYLSELSLAYYGTTVFSARTASDGVSHTNVTTDTTPRFQVSDFLDGDEGILTAYRSNDGGSTYAVTGGSITLSTADETGQENTTNNITLNIIDDEDPYDGVAGSAGFYKQLTARVEQDIAITPQATPYEYKLEHSVTGSASKQIYISEAPALHIADKTLVGGNGGVTEVIQYWSGVPYLFTGTSFDVTFTVENAVGDFYNAEAIGHAVIEGRSSTVATPTETSGLPAGDYAAVCNGIEISSNAQATKNPSITCKGSTPQGAVTSSTITTNWSINGSTNNNAVSYYGSNDEEDIRVRSGSGDYPSQGSGDTQFGAEYDSEQSLVSGWGVNESFYKGAYFHHPYPSLLTDWTGYFPQGPDYSSITDDERWICQKVGSITDASSIRLMFLGGHSGGWPTGWYIDIQNFKIFVKVVGASGTGWLDANAAYGGGNPFNNGTACVDTTESDVNDRRCTFGQATRTGDVYVRSGWDGSGTNSFTGWKLG